MLVAEAHVTLQSHSLMALPVVEATAEANISIPFHQSAGKSSAEGDALFPLLKIRFFTETEAALTGSASVAPPTAPTKG